MNWINLTEEAQIEEIREKSRITPQVIFKHSTRCSISSVAKSRLDKWQPDGKFDFYFLDLIRYRDLSGRIAQEFKVYHASPQVLVIKDGKCIYDESHLSISINDILFHAA